MNYDATGAPLNAGAIEFLYLSHRVAYPDSNTNHNLHLLPRGQQSAGVTALSSAVSDRGAAFP